MKARSVVVQLAAVLGTATLLLWLPKQAASAADDAPSLPLPERVMIATQLYNVISTYFAHWQGAPGFALDEEYHAYLGQILASDNRDEFSLASMAFVAKLNNGHSEFYDARLAERRGQSFGFYAMPLQRKWTVITSRIDAVKPGDVIAAIDGQDFNAFYASKRQYLKASSEADRSAHLFYRRFLFPQVFTLTLSNGRKLQINRIAPLPAGTGPDSGTQTREEGSTLLLSIPGFDDPKFEAAAIAAVQAHMNAPAIIIDVRGNGGGSTPSKLLSVLMDRPYQKWSEATGMRMGVLEVDQEVGDHPTLRWSAPIETPLEDHYQGKLYILTDIRCFSACEDFVEPFKMNHRATLIGTHTGGSSGQPYSKDLGDGFSVRVSTKREYFPDGSEFEGRGIAPDVMVDITPEDLKAGRDPVLAKARGLIAHPH